MGCGCGRSSGGRGRSRRLLRGERLKQWREERKKKLEAKQSKPS